MSIATVNRLIGHYINFVHRINVFDLNFPTTVVAYYHYYFEYNLARMLMINVYF